jgi:ribosomal protein S27AE
MIEVEIDENTPMQFYGEAPEVLAFVRLCPNCGRFVKPDNEVFVNGLEHLVHGENATCSKCGRVEMIFNGYWET